MNTKVQVAFDCDDPHAVARFWAAAVGYEVERHGELVEQLVADGHLRDDETVMVDGERAFADVAACRDPEGIRPRFFFQKVPEGKERKNRLHLDLHFDEGIEPTVERLLGLGASKLWFSDDRGGPCWTLADIEGNEFCIH